MSSKSLIDILNNGTSTAPAANLSDRDKQALSYVLNSNGEFKNELEAREAELEAKAAEEKARQELVDNLKPNQFLLSSITKGTLPTSGVDRVFTRYELTDWPEDVRCDIPAIDTTYYWDPDLLEALWLCYVMNKKGLMVGPPGTGKTSAAKQFAALINHPFARFNGKDGIEPASFLGTAWATGGNMEWKDGLLPQCLKHGYLIVIDEVMKIPPGIQMALQSLYEDNGFLMLDDKPGTIQDKHVYPHEKFRLLATDNTKGTGDSLDKYGAGQYQDVSSLDRFVITINVDYLPKYIEMSMLMNKFPESEERDVKKVIALANLVREGFKNSTLSVTLSPRGLMTIVELMQMGLTLEAACKLSFVNKLGDDSEIEIATRFLKDAA